MSISGRIAVVLLVEDNDNDAELTKLGFAHSELAVELHHVVDGEQCLAFLRKSENFVNAPTPDLILLDLHMPRMNGIEVLRESESDPHLCHLPVVVLTTSDADADIWAAYRMRCNSYIVKPVGFDAFVKAIELLGRYWFGLVSMPTQASVPNALQNAVAGHEAPQDVAHRLGDERRRGARAR
jgi:CheY-like chemotaxis protein